VFGVGEEGGVEARNGDEEDKEKKVEDG